jgi:hypothetical protein
MSVRDEMVDLIARVRLEIGDAGAPPVFDDEAIQSALDEHMREVRYQFTTPRETRQAGGVVVYVDHRFARGCFASDVALLDLNYEPLDLVAEKSDAIAGRFTLTESAQLVYLLGQQFDIYAASADLFDRWAAQVKTDTDFSDGKVSFHDSQLFDHLESCAKRARRKRWPQVGRMISTDFAANF